MTSEAYGEHYEAMVAFLLQEFGKGCLILLGSTPVADEKRDRLVRERNAAVRMIAEKYELPFIDLYAMVSDRSLAGDGVHFPSVVYGIIAERLARMLEGLL